MFSLLKWGSIGSDVRTLQEKLKQLGYTLEVDGYFGQQTDQIIRKFQTDRQLAVDGVVGMNTWKAIIAATETAPTALPMPEFLMLHCSATPDYASGWSAKQIVDYHTKVLRWGRPGYSQIIEYDGKAVETWKVDLSDGFQPFEITYGALEYNPVSIHVCYVGGMSKDNTRPLDTRTDGQYETLSKIVKKYIKEVPNIKVLGHNQVHRKACPCFWVPDFLEDLNIPPKHIVRNDPLNQREFIRGISKRR